jgi:ferredoxin-NADP reductase
MEITRRIKRGWMNLRISKIDRETHDTITLSLVDNEDGGRQFDYISGQYLTFRFDELAPKPVVRSYTMSSSPCEIDYSAITVKTVDNGWISKHLVEETKVGDVLRARGPIGRFCYNPETDQEHLVMIAGGSGVTPFVSILREHADSLGKPGSPRKMSLLVCYKSQRDLICWDLLQKVSKIPGISIVTTLTRENAPEKNFLSGRISEPMIENLVHGDYKNSTYMTCGPTEMMSLVERHLLSHNVAPANIKMESFD